MNIFDDTYNFNPTINNIIALKNLDSYSKTILKNEIQKQFDYFLKHVDSYDVCNYINYLDYENNNPLEHCLINAIIYSINNGPYFLNYYGVSNINQYLHTIGFIINVEYVTNIVKKFKNDNELKNNDFYFKINKFANQDELII